MPRKPLEYTHEYPYHIVARCNNREQFKLELSEVWDIFKTELTELNQRYNFQTHHFVLMSNHYHLIASTDKKYNLGFIMRILQSRTSRTINLKTGRINHVYGRRYRASLIIDPYYYGNALKYLYRNPVTAGICESVVDWKYSTLNNHQGFSIEGFPLSCHLLERGVMLSGINFIKWLNEAYSPEVYEKINLGLTRVQFKFTQRKSPLREYL